MDNRTTLLLNSLRAILANPAFRRPEDKALGEQMSFADTVLAWLVARHSDTPVLAGEIRNAYTQLLPALEKVCGGPDGAPAFSRLKDALDAPELTPEPVFAAAFDLLNVLQAAGSPTTLDLQKQMIEIEGNYSRKFNTALVAAKKPEETGAATAFNSKPYDEQALGRFIAEQYPTEQGVRIAKSSFMSGGASKFTIGIELEGNHALPSSLVMRADAGSGFGGSSVTEEYRLLKVLHAHGAQVAKPLAIEASGGIFGSPFMLVERRPGRMIGHMFIMPAPNLTTSRDVATQLAKIHSVPIDAFGSQTSGADKTTIQYVTAWLDQSYANWKTADAPSALMESSFRWLKENVHLIDGRRTLVHGDYGLNNMLIDNDRVAAVLDWEFAHIGNPVYDLGYFRFQAEALGPWEEFLRAYEAAGGTVPDERQLDYANLLAETRLTVMTRQVEAAYFAGAPLGAAGAFNAASGCRNMSDERIAMLLNRVM